MKSFVTALLVIAPLGLIAGLGQVMMGCATGTDDDPATAFLGTLPKDSGKEELSPSIKLTPPSNPAAPTEEPDAATENDAGTGDDSGGGGGTTDAGTDSGTDGGTDGGGGTVSCNATNTCMGATDLGTVSGDTGADTKSAQGSTSQWFTVRVSEDNSDPFGVELWMTATLVSPPGTNFDLFVYVPGSDTRECNAVSNSSTSTTASDATTAKFGESGTFSNGSNDDRTVTVEVRHVSGTCDPTKKWTLNIEGNK
jgi:hypothetical protein